MIEFVLGLVLGAVLGVVADRLWDRVEKRPRLRLSPSVASKTRDHSDMRFVLTVQNCGRHEIPDYIIELSMSSRGSFTFDVGSSNGPLLPSQKRNHEFTVAQMRRVVQFFDAERPADWGPGLSQRIKSGSRPRGLLLKLVVKGGDKMLFQSGIMGDAMGELFVDAAENGNVGHLDWEALRHN